jgi:hypothetical protein
MGDTRTAFGALLILTIVIIAWQYCMACPAGIARSAEPSHHKKCAELDSDGTSSEDEIQGTGFGETSGLCRRTAALRQIGECERPPAMPAGSLMAAVARRSARGAGVPSGGVAPCLWAGGGAGEGLKEALTSMRRGAPNALTGGRIGLGSTRLDFRFEPGPQSRAAAGDASPSHGGHAGGATLGGFGSNKFLTTGGWDGGYVHGFGDPGGYGPVEAVVTGRPLW